MDKIIIRALEQIIRALGQIVRVFGKIIRASGQTVEALEQTVKMTQILQQLSLSEVAQNQLITVKGKLYQVSGVKTVIMSDSTSVKKKDGVIIDPTGHTKKVNLSQIEHTSQLEKDNT